MIVSNPATEPTNPLFKNFFKYLDEEGKRELLRLEAIEANARIALTPHDVHTCRPLAHLANLYMEFDGVMDDSPVNKLRAINLYHLHYRMAIIEGYL